MDIATCEAIRYAPGKPCSEEPPEFEVVYTSPSSGKQLDCHPTCFDHGMAEVDRHYAAGGIAQADLRARLSP